MRLARRIVLTATLAVGCGDAGDTGGEGEPGAEFVLVDVNPNSASHDVPVSPRDYLERVSGWYFAHAT